MNDNDWIMNTFLIKKIIYQDLIVSRILNFNGGILSCMFVLTTIVLS